MAALRAKTMQRTTRMNNITSLLVFTKGGAAKRKIPGYMVVCHPAGMAKTPNEKPIKANGMAKMVCENFTRLK